MGKPRPKGLLKPNLGLGFSIKPTTLIGLIETRQCLDWSTKVELTSTESGLKSVCECVCGCAHTRARVGTNLGAPNQGRFNSPKRL